MKKIAVNELWDCFSLTIKSIKYQCKDNYLHMVKTL